MCVKRTLAGPAVGLVVALIVGLGADAARGEWRIRKLASWGGQVNAVEVNEPYIYMGSGVRVLILKELGIGNPQQVGYLDFGDIVYGMDYKNGLLYVISGYGTLSILDVSDPAAPVVVGSHVESATPFRAIEVVGVAAYCTGESVTGIFAFDVSNPAAPVKVLDEWQPTSWNLTDVAVADGYLYGANSDDDELVVVQLASPFNPIYRGKLTGLVNPQGLAVSGDYAYVAQGAYPGLVVVDVSDPANPVSIGDYDSTRGVDVAVNGTVAYLAAEDVGGLRVLDVSSPSAPVELSFLDDPGYVWGVTVAGSKAYVTDEGEGLLIVNVADPNNPFRVGNVDSPGRMTTLTLVDDLLYVCDLHLGFTIVDVGDPRTPTTVGQYVSAETSPVFPGAWMTKVFGDYAYVSSGTNGMEIVDVSNPAQPTRVSGIPNPNVGAMGLEVVLGENGVPKYVYTANNIDGFRVFDVTNPMFPILIATHHIQADTGWSMIQEDELLYNTNDFKQWFVTDMSDPLNPVDIAQSEPDWQDIVKVSDLLYTAVYDASEINGMFTFDVSDPEDPISLGSFLTPGNDEHCEGIAVDGTEALLSSWVALYVLDVGDPSSPQAIADYPASRSGDVMTDAPFVYLADSGTAGFGRGVDMLLFYEPGDHDRDRDVDLLDFQELQGCYGDSGIAPADPECLVFDIDEDDDVDGDDFAAFNAYFIGPQ